MNQHIFPTLGKKSPELIFPSAVDLRPAERHNTQMQLSIDKKALVQMLKTVHQRDAGSVGVRNKNQWLRIAAQADAVELQANGFSAGGPATVTEEGVAFVWYKRMLDIVQSFKTDDISVTITPEGMKINTFETGRQAWFAIFDKPGMAPPAMEDVFKNAGPPKTHEQLEFEQEIKHTKAARAIDRILEEKGALADVDSDFYQAFIESTDKEMTAMIRLIIFDRSKEINRHIENRTLTTPKIQELVSSMLNLIALGHIFFREKDHRCALCKPIGPPPTHQQRKAIDARIDAVQEMIQQTFLKICEEQRR